MSEEIIVRETGELAPAARPSDLLQVIAAAVADPRMDVAKMEKLLDMSERIRIEQQRVAFMAAMARVAGKLPEIGKHGTSHHGKYARLLDIDRAIRPLLAEEGLSMSFDSEESQAKVKVTCKLSHAEGHFETKTITLAVDKSGSKNDAQAVISTVSYGRRALTKMFFNLMEADGLEDDDGNGGGGAITAEQVKDLETLILDTKSDKAKFLQLIAGVERLEDIPARDYKRVLNALETKKRANRK